MRVSHDIIAAMSSRIPFAAAARQAAKTGVNTFLQHFYDIADLSAPLETYRTWGLFRSLNFNSFPDEFFHPKRPFGTESPQRCGSAAAERRPL